MSGNDDRPVIVPLTHLEMVLVRYGLRAYVKQFVPGGARDAEDLDKKLGMYWNRHVAMQNIGPKLISDNSTDPVFLINDALASGEEVEIPDV